MAPTAQQKGDVNIYVSVISDAEKRIAKISQQVKKSVGGQVAQLNALNKEYALVDKTLRLQERATMGAKKGFQGWAMSIMFAGMAIQNAMKQIWAASSKTFNDVMHSTEGTVTGFDRLSGSLTYLWFVIGDALAPLADMLIPIIDYIAKIVEENPDAFKWAFVGLSIFGSLSFLIGSIVLATAGFVEAWAIAGGTITSTVEGIGGALGANVLSKLGLIGLAITTLVAMWQTNFGDMKTFLSTTFGSIWDTVKSVTDDIGKLFQGVFEVIKGIFTGDFELIWSGFKKIITGGWDIIIDTFLGSVTIVANIITFLLNVVNDNIYNTQKILLGLIKKAIEFANEGLGLSLDTKLLDKAIATLEDKKLENRLKYVELADVKSMFGVGDETTNQQTTTNNTSNYVSININTPNPLQTVVDELNSRGITWSPASR